jgi:hypothetical protein
LRCHFAAALSTACDAGERPLTLSVVLRARPGRDQTPPGAPRTDFPASSSKGAASSAQSAFHRQVLPRVRFRGARFVGARHQCLGFATEDPASDAPSLPRCSRPEWLDPVSRSSALHRGGVTGQTSPVDFCNQSRSASTTVEPSEPRAPRSWSPTRAAVFRTAAFRQAGRIAGGCARAHANQDVTGQGPGSKAFAFMHGSSRRDRSRWELHPNLIGLDTSCREIVTPPAGDRRCQAIAWMTSLRTRPACPASPRCSPSRVASRKPPRRGMRSAEPEVPSIGGPPRERWVPSSPGCPQPVE